MVDIPAIASLLTALKAAKDIAQTMVGLRDDTEFNQKLIEFQSKLIDANNAAFEAQDERAALLNEIERLNKQIASLEAWESEKQRYQLTQLAPGTTVYMVTEEARGAEPEHCICTNCYEGGRKAILHIMKDQFGAVHITCPNCKTELKY